ncbi:MAG: gliding motility-associated-like protein, partial [Crocinitomicaceae bacterium]
VNPTHIYPADGIYSVQQLVTNVFGCQDSTTLDILIHPQPIAGFSNLTVCAQDVVDFTDTTIGAPTYWEWDFGDGIGTSLSQNTTYVYPVGGFYDVELIAGNAVGCVDTTVVTIEVYTNPVALYSADTVCYLDITTFTDLSSDVVPLATWYYDFGDGINNSGLQNPTYIYQAAGTYPASLTVTNIYGCDSTIQINVVVNNVPIADFTTDTVCWGSPTTFTDISIGTVNTWNWDFGNGFSSTNGPVENYTYPLPGSYLASMEVDGGVGCTDIAYQVVIVVDVLTPAIGVQATACLEEIVQFQDLSVAAPGVLITGWNWDFGDGSTSILQDPLHGYLIPGTYTVTLDVQTSTGCTNSGTTTITVFDPPSSAFDFTIPCEGQPTIFTDNSTDPLGAISYWEWDFGDASLLSFDPSPSHTYAVAGNYDVTLVVASTNGCNDTIIQTVTIYPSPTADFVNGLECGGVPVDLTSTSVGTIVSYEWIYAGSTFSTAQDTLYAFPTTTDTHPVTLVVTTDLGCIDSVTHDVITRPVVSFDFGPFETAGCPVMEVSFFENSLVSSGGAIVNWLWDLGDGSFSFSPNPTHFYEDEGSYTVSLQVITDQDCIYTDTLIYSIIVYPQPTANFTYAPHDISILNPEVDFTNTSSGAQDVEWHFGDFDYSNEWHPTHTYNDTGYFEVAQTVYNEYGCPDTMYQTLYVHGEFVVYAPNSFTPNGDGMNDYFNVKAYGLESYELLIFNRWGELVHTVTEYDVGWDGKYRGQECQSGSYTWKLVGIDFEKIPRDYVGHVILLL